MKDRLRISRRAFAGGALLLALDRRCSLAQGFAGLGMSGDGFAAVVPGKTFTFPTDHGPHPDYRIEWWYVTANLVDSAGAAYGAHFVEVLGEALTAHCVRHALSRRRMAGLPPCDL